MTTQINEEVTADHYTYRIAWSAADNEYVATAVEFPSLTWLDSTREKALSGLTSVIEEVLRDMIEQGEDIPVPWDEREFSGKFNLRLGADLHKKIALEAAERRESMNTYVMKKLSSNES
jgi:predicted HicB family RNase H-like nuclease